LEAGRLWQNTTPPRDDLQNNWTENRVDSHYIVWNFGTENNTSQGWHTIEYRFKLANTPTSNDGVFEMWWDGVNQGPWARIGANSGALDLPGIPTARMGSGFNWFGPGVLAAFEDSA
jgi:hypothetical protein